MDYEQKQPDWAPSDPKWHREYANLFLRFSCELDALNEEAMGFSEGDAAEDLGDYVETISTLLTFRPHTNIEVERDAYEDVYGKEAADALRESDKVLQDRKS
jgi:hypothetical protein